MSYARRMTRPDSNQSQIVEALRKAGVSVWIVGEPVDLLYHYRGKWGVLECKPAVEPGIRVKTRAVRRRTDQDKQQALIRTFAIPVVRTPLEALEAIVGPLPEGLV